MEKINNNYNAIEEPEEKPENKLTITNDNEIINKKYKQYKIIVITSKKELLDAIDKIQEYRWWIKKHKLIKLTVLKNKINVSSINRRNNLIYKTIAINSTTISNPSGKNITFLVEINTLKEALNLINDDKIIIRVGPDYTGASYVIIKPHNLYEKTIVIIKQAILL
jgi:hypothetical protein